MVVSRKKISGPANFYLDKFKNLRKFIIKGKSFEENVWLKVFIIFSMKV